MAPQACKPTVSRTSFWEDPTPAPEPPNRSAGARSQGQAIDREEGCLGEAKKRRRHRCTGRQGGFGVLGKTASQGAGASRFEIDQMES